MRLPPRNRRSRLITNTELRSFLRQDVFDATDNSVFEHHLDAMRMCRRFGEKPLNDSFGKLARPLVLFFDNPNFHARLYLRARAAVRHFDISITSLYVLTSPALNALRCSAIGLSSDADLKP